MKKLPYEFEDLGEQSVKNIAQPVRAFRLILERRNLVAQWGEAATPGSQRVENDVPSLSDSSATPDSQVLRRSLKTRLVYVIRKTGKYNCHFGSLVRNSDNPKLIQAHLEKYPKGDFISLAQIRLAGIER